MEADLHRALLGRGTMYRDLDPLVLSQLAAAAEQHGLSVKQAAGAFDKFMTVNRMEKKCVEAEDVAAFCTDLARGSSRPQPLAAARASNLFNRVSLEDVVLAEVDAADDGEAAAQQQGAPAPASQRITPYLSKVAPLRPTPSTGGKFAERGNAGSVVSSLNSHLEVPEAAAAAEGSGGEAMEVDGGGAQGQQRAQPGRLQVEVLGQPLGPGAKYMVERLEERAAYLERRIVAAEVAAEAALGLEAHPVAVAAQQEALFVGRVVCDAEGGRLNPASLLLEGSMRSSSGARVRLDVSTCPAYRLFPGQVVALRGTNPSGHCVVAAQLLPGLAAPLPRTPLAELAGYAAATGQRGTSVVLAAGPYTSSEDLEYAPLAALLDYCAGQPAAHRPDVLLLLGPFVDADHPLVQGGLLEETFEEVYASRVLGQVAAFSERVGSATRVLLVPSTRDVHHHPVLPQPPLDGAQAAAAGGATALANPSTLRLNEVVLGCTSADWLMACNREEVSRSAPGAPQERLPALAAHLPAQRSYFPLFPPPADVPLDCSHGVTALQMPVCTPDLLVLPSDLAPFAKLCPVHTLESAAAGMAQGEQPAAQEEQQAAAAPAVAQQPANAVCINPGRLTKGASGGTFAHIHILPLPEAIDVAGGAPAATNAPVSHQLDKRCRVDIKRI